MATRRDFSKVILVSLLILVVEFAEESSQTHAITFPAKCLKECSPVLVEGVKRKVSRVFDASCYQLCLKKRQVTARQTLITENNMKKRIRKELPPNHDCPNSSPAQSVDWLPSVVNVSFGRYENTNHWFANLSWTPMNDLYGKWTAILVRLAVVTNNSFKARVNCFLPPKNQTFLKINISSYGYRYPDAIFLKINGFPYSWRDESDVKRYAPEFATTRPTTVQIKGSSHSTTVYVSISIGLLFGIFLVASLLKYFVCRKKTILLPQEFEYHAFIIYNHADSLWVIRKLLPLLEEKHHLKCCVHYRDFPPGKPFEESMAESVYKSYKIIAVLSSNFLKSNYCNYELNIAKYRLLHRGDDSLVMIRIDEADSKKLPRELRKRNFIDYCNLLERPFWEDKLLKFLNARPNDDFRTQPATIQQNYDQNSNCINGKDGRNDMNRFNSTTSNDTEMSVVSQANDAETII